MLTVTLSAKIRLKLSNVWICTNILVTTGGGAVSPPISLLRRHRDFRRPWTGETISVFGSDGRRRGQLRRRDRHGRDTHRDGSARSGPARSQTALQPDCWRLGRFACGGQPLIIGAGLGRFALLATIPLTAMLGHLRMNFLYTR
jgi:hypothetical protein